MIKKAESLIETLCSEPYHNSVFNKRAVRRLSFFIRDYQNGIQLILNDRVKRNEATDIRYRNYWPSEEPRAGNKGSK